MKSKVFPQNRAKIKECLGIDDFVADMLEGECNRDVDITLLSRHPFLFPGLLSLITNVLFSIIGLKRKVQSKDDDFIFVSCSDPSFRTKTIDLIASGLNYCIIYLPNFHIRVSIRYHKFFKKNNIKAFFPTIKFGDVIKARSKVNELKKKMDGLGADEDSIKVISIISNYIIYDRVVKRYLSQIESFKGKWILEHQKFIFMATVANLYQRGIKSTMLQHGIFFKPVYDFIPLLCDKVLCCSEREKKIYIDSGTQEKRIEVFGAPLQTLQLTKSSQNNVENYDLLIMMTMVTEKNVELTREVLEYIKGNYDRVLVRMRPRSRKGDEALLSDVLAGMTLSPEGTPIGDDIMNCKKAVSFSVDANVEISKFRKPFIFIWDQDLSEPVEKLNCATANTYKEEIIKLMNNDFYSTFSENQYKDILGETDVEILKKKFSDYIAK